MSDEYGKGVVFYLRDKKVVGVLMWNLYNKIPVAEHILKENKTYENFDELSHLFNLYKTEDEEEEEEKKETPNASSSATNSEEKKEI